MSLTQVHNRFTPLWYRDLEENSAGSASAAMAERSSSLAQIRLFRSLDREAVQRLDSQCLWRRAAAKEWILDHEDEGADVFFVIVGHARVLVRTVSGKETILADIQSGDFFGELSAIDGKPRSASILAITNLVLARMPAAVFRRAIDDFPDVRAQLLQRLVSRVRELSERISEFAAFDVRHRIYAELLRLSRPDPADQNQALLSPPPIHAEIAARVSTRREAVARELKALERAGLLLRRRGALIVTDVRGMVQRLEEAREAD